jgi:hypothetical protein
MVPISETRAGSYRRPASCEVSRYGRGGDLHTMPVSGRPRFRWCVRPSSMRDHLTPGCSRICRRRRAERGRSGWVQ